jgi:hypothetical protein
MNMHPFAAALLAASFVLAPAVARADDDPPAPAAAPATPEKATTWYGYQTLATDGVALALLIPAAGGGAGTSGFGVGSLAMYGLGAPIVHFAHGQIGKGFLDLGLRAAIPIATTGIGLGIGSAIPANNQNAWLDTNNHALEGGAIGLVLGPIIAVVVDAAVLANEPAAKDGARDPEPRPAPQSASLQPSFGVAPEKTGGTRTTVGVMGTF